jgi:hypothetical protein
MKVNNLVVALAVFTALTIVPVQAQMSSSGSAPSSQSAPQGSPGARAGRVQCWQQAGIPQSTVEEYRSMMRSTRQEVESVCSDTSLSPSQKQEKVQQLHAQARQQMEGLVTQQQLQAFESCQKEHGEHRGGMGGGGCGAAGGNRQAVPTQ